MSSSPVHGASPFSPPIDRRVGRINDRCLPSALFTGPLWSLGPASRKTDKAFSCVFIMGAMDYNDSPDTPALNTEMQCGECHGTDLGVQSTREICAKDSDRICARTIWVVCHICGNSWPVVKRLPNT